MILFCRREEGRLYRRGWVSGGVWGGRNLRGRLQSGGGVAAAMTTSLTESPDLRPLWLTCVHCCLSFTVSLQSRHSPPHFLFLTNYT